MKIALVDDEQKDIVLLKSLIMDYDKDKIFEIIAFNDERELLNVKLSEFKILFLDIDMPQINGIELAKYIIQQNSNIKIIFVTNRVSLVTKALHNCAFSFIPKPIDKSDLYMEIDRALKVIKSESFILKVLWNTQEEFVKVKDILFIESFNKKCIIHLYNGEELYSSNNLKNYAFELKLHSFVQVHKSFLVNVAYIKSIAKSEIKLINYNDYIKISRKYKEDFNRLYNCYINRVCI